jgi:hypothetical protein
MNGNGPARGLDPFIPFSASEYTTYANPDGELKSFGDQHNHPTKKRKDNNGFWAQIKKLETGSDPAKKLAPLTRNTANSILAEAVHSRVQQPTVTRTKKRTKEYTEAEIEEQLVPVPFEDREKDNDIPKMPFGEAVGQHPFRSIFSGASNTGKSTLWGFLMRQHFCKYFDEIYVLSKTFDLDPIYKQLIKEGCLKKENCRNFFDQALIDEIKSNQLREIESLGGKTHAKRVYLDINDFADDNKAMGASAIVDLYFSCRHYNMSVSIQTQKFNRVHLRPRTSATNIFVFSPTNGVEADIICNELAHPILGPTREAKKKFHAIFKLCTEDPKNPWSFLHVNYQVKDRTQLYRKGLKEVVDLGEYGINKEADKKPEQNTGQAAVLKTEPGRIIRDEQPKTKTPDQNYPTQHLPKVRSGK